MPLNRADKPNLLPTPDSLEKIKQRVTAQLKEQLLYFAGKYPAACSIDGHYPLTINTDWTTGFWSGMCWLAWQMSSEPFFLQQLQQQIPGFGERLAARRDIETHDLGFLYSLSCVNLWRSTGDEDARRYALQAAELLAVRYHPQAQIIQAWGDLQDESQQGRMIIDCMMNLPLLYWASEQTGDARFGKLAHHHAAQACNYLVRDDYSTFHTFYMDVKSGAPRKGTTHQGFADDSCWARGQAWAIYGFALSYACTGEQRFLDTAVETARYFLAYLPADKICAWDLHLNADNTAKDSSAAAIAVCGLLELIKHLSVLHPQRQHFTQQALSILEQLCAEYYRHDEVSNGYLRHAVYNMNKQRGVDEYCLWGDYFFFEALSRVISPLAKYW